MIPASLETLFRVKTFLSPTLLTVALGAVSKIAAG